MVSIAGIGQVGGEVDIPRGWSGQPCRRWRPCQPTHGHPRKPRRSWLCLSDKVRAEIGKKGYMTAGLLLFASLLASEVLP